MVYSEFVLCLLLRYLYRTDHTLIAFSVYTTREVALIKISLKYKSAVTRQPNMRAWITVFILAATNTAEV